MDREPVLMHRHPSTDSTRPIAVEAVSTRFRDELSADAWTRLQAVANRAEFLVTDATATTIVKKRKGMLLLMRKKRRRGVDVKL